MHIIKACGVNAATATIDALTEKYSVLVVTLSFRIRIDDGGADRVVQACTESGAAYDAFAPHDKGLPFDIGISELLGLVETAQLAREHLRACTGPGAVIFVDRSNGKVLARLAARMARHRAKSTGLSISNRIGEPLDPRCAGFAKIFESEQSSFVKEALTNAYHKPLSK